MRTPTRGPSVIAALITAIAAILIVVLPAANAVAASPKGSGTSSQSHSGPGKSQKAKPPSAGNRGPDAKTLNPRPQAPSAPRNTAPSPSSPGAGTPGGTQQQKPSTKPRKPIPKPDRDPHKFSPKTKAPGNSSNYDKPGSNRKKSGNSARDRDDDEQSGPSQNRGPNKFAPRTPSRPDSSPDRDSHGTPGTNKDKDKWPRDRSEDVPAKPLDNPSMDGTDNNGDGIVDNENPFEELPPIEIQPPRGGGFPLPGLKPAPQGPRAPAPKEGAPKENAPKPDTGQGSGQQPAKPAAPKVASRADAEKILKDGARLEKSRKSEIWAKRGTDSDAQREFERIAEGYPVRQYDNGTKVVRLPDGSDVSLRGSSDGRTTISIQAPGQPPIKVRFDPAG